MSTNMNPGILQAICLAIVTFSEVEEVLVFGAGALMVGTNADDTGEFVLRKLQFRGLLETFCGLYRHRFGNDDADALKRLCDELDRLNSNRNELVHSFWTVGDIDQTLTRHRKLIRRGGVTLSRQIVRKVDVLKFAERANELYREVLTFIVDRILSRVDEVVRETPRQ